MARHDITDGTHRATTEPVTAAFGLADGGLVIYQRGTPDAWIEADEGRDLEEVR